MTDVCDHWLVSKQPCNRPSIGIYDGRSRCILHSPDPAKSEQAFRDALTDLFPSFDAPPSTTDLSGVTFNIPFGAQFKGSLLLNHAHLCEGASIKGSGHLDLSYAVCADIKLGSHFHEFSGTLDARGLQCGDVYFKRVKIGEANLHSVNVGGITRDNADINSLDLSHAVVGGPSDLTAQVIKARRARFTDAVEFSSCVSIDAAGSTFSKHLELRRLEIKQSLVLRNCEFLEGLTLYAVSLPGQRGLTVRPSDSSKHGGILDLSGVVFGASARVSVRSVNRDIQEGVLLRCRQLALKDLDVQDIRWPRVGPGEHARILLQDELDIGVVSDDLHAEEAGNDMDHEFEHVIKATQEVSAECYRRLADMFEGQRAFALEDAATTSAMEMTRLSPTTTGAHRTGLHIYRCVSGYGMNYARTAVWLVCVFLAFGVIYALPFSGLHSARYHIRPDSWSVALAAGMLHSLEVGTLQRQYYYVTESVIAQGAAIVQSVTVAVLAALFLFAVRRSFKR